MRGVRPGRFTKMMGRSYLVILLCRTLCFLVSVEGTRSTESPWRGAPVVNAKPDDLNASLSRAQHVRNILSMRLSAVCRGTRGRQFSKWFLSNGQAFVVSTHGSKDTEVSIELPTQEPCLSSLQLNHGDGFPPDFRFLHMVSTDQGPSRDSQMNSQDDSTRRSNFVQLYCRGVQLGINFSPVISTVGIAVIWPKFRRETWYKWLGSCIGTSGPAWIKWGQWSATRNDMFPEALCDVLSQLHSGAPSHQWSISQDTTERSLGIAKGTIRQVFDEFDEEPIASGSIAQVHRAVLDGQTVAVKIRHPKVARLMDLDFRIMSAVAWICDLVPSLSWLRVRETVNQFCHTLAAQAHLHVEGHHLEILNHNFRGWQHVRFPHPVFATSACIIETFEPGIIVTSMLDQYESLAEYVNLGKLQGYVAGSESTKSSLVTASDLVPISLAQFIVTTGVGVYFKMLLVDNLMHADLHPGNLLLKIGQSGKDYVVSLVDAGMVAKLTDDEASTFIGLLASLGEGNGREAAYFTLQFSIENEQLSTEQTDAFARDMETLFQETCRGYGNNVDVGLVLRGVLGLVRNHRIRIDANFATLFINALCLDSMARAVCPVYNVLDFARPLLQSYKRICYDHENNPKPNARRSAWLRVCLSFMYVVKQQAESSFFAKRAIEHEDHVLVSELH